MDLPVDDAIVAGLAADEIAAGNLIAAFGAAGIALQSIRIGAQDSARALAIATAHGVRGDVSPEDPLAGAPGLGTEADHRRRVDRGGMIGALAGALIGAVFGMLPPGRFVSPSPDQAPLVDALLFFAAGGISGVVLGGSFGEQLSTHAGFRLIDGMAEGRIAVSVSCASPQTADVRAIFDEQRASDIVVIG